MKLKTIGVFAVAILLVVVMFNLHQWLGYRFDKDIETTRVMETVKSLSNPTMGDLSAGSPGSEKAARYIAERFKKMGLDKLQGSSDYLQLIEPGEYSVVGVLQGTESKKTGCQVILTHYDGAKGGIQISDTTGVATMLETAAVLTQGKEGRIVPKKTLVFVAVGGHHADGSSAAIKALIKSIGCPIPKLKVLVIGDVGRNNEVPLPVGIVENDRFGAMIMDRFVICAGDIGTAAERTTLNRGEVVTLSAEKIVAAQVDSGDASKPAAGINNLSEKRFEDVLRAILRFIDQTAL